MNNFLIERAAMCAFVAACTLHANAAQLDTTADAVLGQPNFTTNVAGAGASAFELPLSVGVDPVSGRVFVADYSNNRVLAWPSSAAFTNGQAADLVLGQTNFTADGFACSATAMRTPAGIAVDQFGNVYVADRGNHRVLSFKPPLSSGMAATGWLGQVDLASCSANRGGTAAANTLHTPNGLALDANGQLYVTELGNHRVLRFVARAALAQGTGLALQIYGQAAPTGSLANQGGAPSASTLNSPNFVAVDPAGNLWISDTANNRALRYDIVAGTINNAADLVLGQADFVTATIPPAVNASSLAEPTGLAFDASGALYVGDLNRRRVLRFTTLSNNVAATAVFGQGGSFTTGALAVTADGLSAVGALAVDSNGNLLVSDWLANRVLRFDLPRPNGAPALASISPEFVPAGSPAFVLTANGAGFVAGSTVNWNGTPRPTQFISEKRVIAQIPASDVASGGPFTVTISTPAPGGGASSLVNFTLDSRAPLDASADRVLGQPDFATAVVNNPQVGEEQLGGVAAATIAGQELYVTVDPVSGRLFVTDQPSNRILSWPNGAAFTNASSPDVIIGQPNEYSSGCNTGGIGAATLCTPTQVAVDAFGALYVDDFTNNRVLQYVPPFSTGMAASRVFGQGGAFTSGICNNGGLGPNSLCGPRGLVVSDASLFVADGANSRIVVYNNPYGDFTADVVIGQPNFTTATLVAASATSVSTTVYGMSIDRQGRLMVPDSGNSRVLRFSPPFTNGMAADLVIGQADFVTSTPGTVTASSLGFPVAAVIDRGGSLLVTDRVRHRVLRYPAPLTSGMAATAVIGQADFVTATPGALATKFFNPRGLALDPVGNLYVGDSNNQRILAFDRPFATPLPKSDTTGNGKSDLVWRASDGGFAVWDMNGGTLAGFFFGIVGTEWQVIATGDFNGDGKADLFWRRNDGATYLWFMDGTRPVAFVNTGVVPLDYTPVAVADFNGDGHADVMFRRSNGQNYMWLMVNGLITSQGFFDSLPVEWAVQGAGDLTGDGAADIVWRNTNTNETYVWTMDGSAVLSSGLVLPTLDATWQIQGVADFDGDGKDDIQWRRNDGNNYLFAMNGSAVKAYIEQADVGPEWVIQGFGDFNADGFADIVYRHSTSGEVVIWLMKVNAPTATPSLGNPGSIWTIVAPKR